MKEEPLLVQLTNLTGEMKEVIVEIDSIIAALEKRNISTEELLLRMKILRRIIAGVDK